MSFYRGVYCLAEMKFQLGITGWKSPYNQPLKVILYIKSNKKLHKSLKTITFEIMELYYRLIKFSKKIQAEVSENWLYLAAATFTLFCFIM